MRMKKILPLALIAIISFIIVITCSADALDPLGLSNKALGGGALNQYTPGVTDGIGLNNIGLLVRTSGQVTYIDTINQFFYIDDGSGFNDQSGLPGATGIRVSYKDLAPGNTFNPPDALGRYVLITGISSTTELTIGETTRIIPTLRPRQQTDMQDVTP